MFKNKLEITNIRDALYKVYDLERLCGRISFGSANAKDLLQLKSSLKVLPSIKDKILYLHPKEGNEFVKANYSKEDISDDGEKLWIVNPYAKEHPGIHNDKNIVNNGLYPSELFNMSAIKIPEDETFMMGDNRDHSNDSRFWGTVPYKYIVGTPWFIYFSWNDNKEIRWDRVLKTVETLEKTVDFDKLKIEQQEGIY